MPFQSKAQMRAAFGGHLGPEMQAKAQSWAHETPNITRLPEHKPSPTRDKGRHRREAYLKALKG